MEGAAGTEYNGKKCPIHFLDMLMIDWDDLVFRVHSFVVARVVLLILSRGSIVGGNVK